MTKTHQEYIQTILNNIKLLLTTTSIVTREQQVLLLNKLIEKTDVTTAFNNILEMLSNLLCGKFSNQLITLINEVECERAKETAANSEMPSKHHSTPRTTAAAATSVHSPEQSLTPSDLSSLLPSSSFIKIMQLLRQLDDKCSQIVAIPKADFATCDTEIRQLCKDVDDLFATLRERLNEAHIIMQACEEFAVVHHTTQSFNAETLTQNVFMFCLSYCKRHSQISNQFIGNIYKLLFECHLADLATKLNWMNVVLSCVMTEHEDIYRQPQLLQATPTKRPNSTPVPAASLQFNTMRIIAMEFAERYSATKYQPAASSSNNATAINLRELPYAIPFICAVNSKELNENLEEISRRIRSLQV